MLLFTLEDFVVIVQQVKFVSVLCVIRECLQLGFRSIIHKLLISMINLRKILGVQGNTTGDVKYALLTILSITGRGARDIVCVRLLSFGNSL